MGPPRRQKLPLFISDYILEVQRNDLEERMNQYEAEFRKIAEQEKYREKVQSLICYRGIDILSAMILIAAIGDARLMELESSLQKKRPGQPGLISHFLPIDGPVIHMSGFNQQKALKFREQCMPRYRRFQSRY
jgi:hypothetical protein